MMKIKKGKIISFPKKKVKKQNIKRRVEKIDLKNRFNQLYRKK